MSLNWKTITKPFVRDDKHPRLGNRSHELCPYCGAALTQAVYTNENDWYFYACKRLESCPRAKWMFQIRRVSGETRVVREWENIVSRLDALSRKQLPAPASNGRSHANPPNERNSKGFGGGGDEQRQRKPRPATKSSTIQPPQRLVIETAAPKSTQKKVGFKPGELIRATTFSQRLGYVPSVEELARELNIDHAKASVLRFKLLDSKDALFATHETNEREAAGGTDKPYSYISDHGSHARDEPKERILAQHTKAAQGSAWGKRAFVISCFVAVILIIGATFYGVMGKVDQTSQLGKEIVPTQQTSATVNTKNAAANSETADACFYDYLGFFNNDPPSEMLVERLQEDLGLGTSVDPNDLDRAHMLKIWDTIRNYPVDGSLVGDSTVRNVETYWASQLAHQKVLTIKIPTYLLRENGATCPK